MENIEHDIIMIIRTVRGFSEVFLKRLWLIKKIVRTRSCIFSPITFYVAMNHNRFSEDIEEILLSRRKYMVIEPVLYRTFPPPHSS